MLSPKLDLAYFRSLKPLTRRDGLVPLGICVGLAVVFGAWLVQTDWGIRNHRLAEGLWALSGFLGAGFGFLFLHVYQPLAIPVLTGNWARTAAMADALGLELGGIDTRRKTYLANQRLLNSLGRLREDCDGALHLLDSNLTLASAGDPPLALLGRVARDGGMVTSRFTWRGAEKAQRSNYSVAHSFGLGVVAVMGVDTTELEGLRARFKQLQRRMALEQMIEGFAHDAQNLIFAGRLATSGLAEEIGPSHGSKEKVQVLNQVFEEAGRVVERMMSWSAVSSSEGPLELNTFLRELAPFFGYLAPRPIQVKVVCADKPLWAFLDSTALSHALFNMIANAREAMLLAQQTAGVILVELEGVASPGEVTLRIKDDGPGVPIALRERIFRPYVSTKGAGEGHGLGLALARVFAERSGGSLELETTKKGACFAFTFPICEAPTGGGLEPCVPRHDGVEVGGREGFIGAATRFQYEEAVAAYLGEVVALFPKRFLD